MSRFAAERGQYEFGKVAHALAAGMQRLLREYLVLVAQLENQLLQVGAWVFKIFPGVCLEKEPGGRGEGGELSSASYPAPGGKGGVCVFCPPKAAASSASSAITVLFRKRKLTRSLCR